MYMLKVKRQQLKTTCKTFLGPCHRQKSKLHKCTDAKSCLRPVISRRNAWHWPRASLQRFRYPGIWAKTQGKQVSRIPQTHTPKTQGKPVAKILHAHPHNIPHAPPCRFKLKRTRALPKSGWTPSLLGREGMRAYWTLSRFLASTSGSLQALLSENRSPYLARSHRPRSCAAASLARCPGRLVCPAPRQRYRPSLLAPTPPLGLAFPSPKTPGAQTQSRRDEGNRALN